MLKLSEEQKAHIEQNFDQIKQILKNKIRNSHRVFRKYRINTNEALDIAIGHIPFAMTKWNPEKSKDSNINNYIALKSYFETIDECRDLNRHYMKGIKERKEVYKLQEECKYSNNSDLHDKLNHKLGKYLPPIFRHGMGSRGQLDIQDFKIDDEKEAKELKEFLIKKTENHFSKPTENDIVCREIIKEILIPKAYNDQGITFKQLKTKIGLPMSTIIKVVKSKTIETFIFDILNEQRSGKTTI